MKHKGFTIVELVVVIVVIAILASITVAAYTFMKNDAMDAKIRSATKAVGDALALSEAQKALPTAQGTWGITTNGVDTLVPKYLPVGYRDGINSAKTTSANIIRWYKCAATSGAGDAIIVYAALSNPTADDTTAFGNLRTKCGHGETQAPAAVYNYARLF